MAVFRVERTHNYTVMSNYHLRDKSLSLKAKGLLSQMLSLPENWDYTLAGLARINSEGKDAIRAAVVELEQAGYVQRRQTVDKKGKFGANEYVIREYPVNQTPPPEEPSCISPLPENPTTASPSTADTPTKKPTQRKIDQKIKIKEIPNARNTDSLPFPPTPQIPAAQLQEAKGRKRTQAMSEQELMSYRALILENIRYDEFVQEHPDDLPQLDEMVELMVETVCSKRKTIRVSGNEFPQAVVKSRLLKLNGEHIRFVFDALRENTTRVRNVKQYLLAVLYNAPVTMENHYAAQANYDLYGSGAAA